MGIREFQAPLWPRIAGLGLVVGVIATIAGAAGCRSGGSSSVSAKLFVAPYTEPSTVDSTRGIVRRAARNDFLRAINPRALESDFADAQPSAFALGRLSKLNYDTGKPELTENLLIYESQSRSLLSVSLLSETPCSTTNPVPDPVRSLVRLHYSTKGLDAVQGETATISSTVTPIKLKNGWILAFDSSSKNIIGFREEEPRIAVDDLDGDGVAGPRTVPFRSALVDPRNPCIINPDSKNFGNGNGLYVSVVISGEETVTQLSGLKVFAKPIVSRLVEIEDNKVLVFFASGTIRSVNLLELREETVVEDFNLDGQVLESEKFGVSRLRGTYKVYPTAVPQTKEPLLSFRQIAEQVTGNQDLRLDSVQPVVYTHRSLNVPFALVFDQTTSTFLRIGLKHELDDPAGPVTGAVVVRAVNAAVLTQALQGSDATTTVSPPFLFREGFQRSDGRREILFFESKSANVIAYDPDPALGDVKSLSIFVDASGFLFRRDPRKQVLPGSANTKDLSFSTGDIRLNRLAFDRDFRQLISISYSSGVVVVVASADEIKVVTGDPIANLTYVEPLDDNNVRAFDSRTTSLLEFRIGYTAFPVRIN